MTYINLDTCVWLGLIKFGLNSESNIFDEICFWIENGHLVHIVPENMIREWDRNKVTKMSQIINDVKRLHSDTIILRGNEDLASAYNPDRISEIIAERVNRVDRILKNHSELAKEDDQIIKAAVNRNIQCLAPNHSKDSFRDTLNILTFISHIEANHYANCVFTTINYNDFSESKAKMFDVHPQLVDLFKRANIQYVYCKEDAYFGQKLFDVTLRPNLPSYADHLKEKRNSDQEKELEERRLTINASVENLDSDYLENVRYIDQIIAKKSPNAFELKMVRDLIDSHESYKQYFLRNVGNNGLV